jgi:quinol monooxygenase YgiN
MFVRHKVNDYGNWKGVYDEFASTRQEKGVTGASVHRDANDPNTIIVTHRFKDIKAATAFANSEELKSAMASAGVAGPPEIWFTEDMEQTSY